MGSNKIDRIGEKNINNFGSEMIIVEYNGSRDVDVYFPEYDWTAKGVRYGHFKDGGIKCPYEKTVFGMGYIGECKYNPYKNKRATKVYATWKDMLKRCYYEKYQEKNPTYKDCKVCDEWLNFQNYGRWFEENYYEVNGESMCLDKDILVKHNKIYSPETCIFVPQAINKLFTKSDKTRSKSVIGVHSYINGKYQVSCNLINLETGKSKQKTLGYYNTQEKAFEVYKHYKEKNIKDIADYFKGQISDKLYQSLYNYIVEIDD